MLQTGQVRLRRFQVSSATQLVGTRQASADTSLSNPGEGKGENEELRRGAGSELPALEL